SGWLGDTDALGEGSTELLTEGDALGLGSWELEGLGSWELEGLGSCELEGLGSASWASVVSTGVPSGVAITSGPAVGSKLRSRSWRPWRPVRKRRRARPPPLVVRSATWTPLLRSWKVVFGGSPPTRTGGLAPTAAGWAMVGQAPPAPAILAGEVRDSVATGGGGGVRPSEFSKKAKKRAPRLRVMAVSPLMGRRPKRSACGGRITPRGAAPQGAAALGSDAALAGVRGPNVWAMRHDRTFAPSPSPARRCMASAVWLVCRRETAPG